jgi:hypothetical protein
VSTGFGGDELALCEPDANDGMLIHIGPSDYADPAQIQAYTLNPGDEEEFCLRVNTPNTESKWLKAYHGRMRPYSHHWIVTETAQQPENDPLPWKCEPIGAVTERWLLASQWPTFDIANLTGGTEPQPGDPDFGLSREIAPQETLNLDIHYANAGDQPILREAWATLEYQDPSEVKTKLDVLSWINTKIDFPRLQHGITPRFTTGAAKDTAGVEQPVYLGIVVPHAHKRLQRLSLYRTPKGGTEELIYEDHDATHPGTGYFRDGLENPALPVTSGNTWGAFSGYIKVNPGDSLSFECEYQSTTSTDPDPSISQITFGETTKQEMCNVFGLYYPSLGTTWTVVQ